MSETIFISIASYRDAYCTKTLDSILTDNSSFKSAFSNINSSITDINASNSSLK